MILPVGLCSFVAAALLLVTLTSYAQDWSEWEQKIAVSQSHDWLVIKAPAKHSGICNSHIIMV